MQRFIWGSRLLAVFLIAGVLALSTPVSYIYAASSSIPGVNNTAGRQRVLEAIPAIARAFAPVAGVDWKDFAKTLAGICAVESTCSPTYPHWVNGKYSQYQGLFQMNTKEVAKAEKSIQEMLPKIRAAAGSDPEQQKAVKFVEDAIKAGQSMSGDKRFHPEYGMILGAAKHIQIHKQLEQKYPGDALRQAAGHMTAQFSGVTEGKIRAGKFDALISGNPYDGHSEAWALAQNKTGGKTVAQAIESAGSVFGKKMLSMMNQLNSATNGLTGIPTVVKPFNAPAFQAGPGPVLDEPYSAVSTLKETGYLNPNGTWATPMSSPMPMMQAPSAPQTTIGQITTGLKNLIQGEPPKAVLSITARPQSVSKGEKITIIWTAAGVAANSCVVYDHKATALGRGESGSKSYTVTSASETVLEFTLKCKDLSSTAQLVEDKTVVSIDAYPSSSEVGGNSSSNTTGSNGASADSGATFDELLAATLAEKKKREENATNTTSPLDTPTEYQGPMDDVRLVPTDDISETPVPTIPRSSDAVYIKKGSNTTFDSTEGDIAVVVDLATGEEIPTEDTADQSAVLTVLSDVLKNIQTALNEIGRILLRR